MKINIRIVYIVLCLFLLSPPTLANNKKHTSLKAIDPIGWAINPSTGFPATTTLGNNYSVTYTMTNNLPFAVPLSISTKYQGGKFSMVNNCNTTLQPNGTCQVFLSFQPIQVGTSNATLTLAYHKNRVPLPTLSSISQSQETGDRISGHVTTPLNPPNYVGVEYPVQFTFINNGDKSVTATAVNVSGFTASTNTCTAALVAHSTCVVSGNFTPSAAGSVTLGVTYVYSGGSIPLTTSTNVINGSGGCHSISAYAVLPLPATTLIYANNVVEFVFRNNCPATTETLNSISITTDSTSSSPPTLLQGSVTPLPPLTACGNSLAPLASCAVFASLIPNDVYPSSNDLTLTALLTYNGSNTVDVSTSEVVSPLTGDNNIHYFMFNNQCSQDVWYGFNPGGTPADPTTNSSWQNYQLDQQVAGAAPGTQILQFSQYNGGSIFGRTGCQTDPAQANYGICNTANCTAVNNATGRCSYAPNPPFTIFEENLYTAASGTADGVYDISIINGFNLPGEFRSLSPYHLAIPNFSNTCGNSAGALLQPSGSQLGNCSWSFTPPAGSVDCTAGTNTDNTNNFYVVSYGTSNDGCTTNSSCASASDVCGYSQSLNPSSVPVGTPLYRHCGSWQGYWTLADWTSFSDPQQWGGSISRCDLYAHYSMGTALGTSTYGYSTQFPASTMPPATFADLYNCKPTSEIPCYNNLPKSTACFIPQVNPYFALNTGYGNTYNVCGCHDWNISSSTPASAQTAQSAQCTADNSLWESNVYNRILWLKEACPTAYSYQFDDKSSSFQCNVSGHLTSYQLTFCPGGKTGAPGT